MNGKSATLMISRLAVLWRTRSQREQRLLLAAGIFLLLLGLALSLGWAHSEHQRLRRAVPQAEARLGQMQMASDERARLLTQPLPARLAGSALTDALLGSARARNLILTAQPSGDGVQVKGQGGFDAVVAWLADVQRDHALRPTRTEILRDGAGTRFEATLVFPPQP